VKYVTIKKGIQLDFTATIGVITIIE